MLKEVEGMIEDNTIPFDEIENRAVDVLNFGRMLNRLERDLPDWHYVDGYNGYDSRITIQNKKCGHLKSISMITLRHKGQCPNIECDACTQERLAKVKRERKGRVERRKFEKEVRPFAQDQIRMLICQQCNQYFYGKEEDKFCSEECKTKSKKQYSNRLKEIKKRKAHTEESKYINLESLYSRDNGVCYLCGMKCDYNADPNSDYYPSIDHVIPVAKGGKDRWDNVRLAHRKCNYIKSDNDNFKDIRIALLN